MWDVTIFKAVVVAVLALTIIAKELRCAGIALRSNLTVDDRAWFTDPHAQRRIKGRVVSTGVTDGLVLMEDRKGYLYLVHIDDLHATRFYI